VKNVQTRQMTLESHDCTVAVTVTLFNLQTS